MKVSELAEILENYADDIEVILEDSDQSLNSIESIYCVSCANPPQLIISATKDMERKF